MARRMKMQVFKNLINVREWSIVTKVTVLVCGIVMLLVVVSGALLINVELDMISTFMEKHQEKITRSFDDRKQGEQVNLQEFIAFIGEILNQAGAEYLFTHKSEEMYELLNPYLKHPAISAIRT